MSREFQFLMYQSVDEDISVNAVIHDETIWLTQKSMAKLFDVDVPAISKHLSNIYGDGELTQDSTVSKMEIVQQEGNRQVKRTQNFYNLDAIISVGYRVNSRRATQFRIWATSVLKEYMIKGFAMDDERLKQGKTVLEKITSVNYWKEFVPSVRVSVVFGSRLLIFLRNAVSTMTRTRRLPMNFMRWCRINFIMQLRDKRRQKLFIRKQTD